MIENRNERVVHTLNRRQPDLTVIMENVHKPHNLSAIARTCDGIGVGHIHAVVPEGSLRLGGKAASGTQKWVKASYSRDTETTVRSLQHDGFTVYAADISDKAIDYREIDYTKPSAILVGSELVGVSAEAANLADHVMTVPLYGMVESLNVSVATAIVLYEAARQREAVGMYSKCRIPDAEFDKLRFEWLHPAVAKHCQKHKLPYPSLDDDGFIVDGISGNERKGYAAAVAND